VHAEQQRFWIALLNLHRSWTSDEGAQAFVPPRHRDFESRPDWPRAKAEAYLLNNLELLRESHERLEAGRLPDFEAVNLVLRDCALRLSAWPRVEDLRRAALAKREMGVRLELLQATGDLETSNPGTRYIRATIQRAFYYFAQYVDHRLSDPLFPDASPGGWRVLHAEDDSGNLVLSEPGAQADRADLAEAP
jgi:hypothetical protein